MTVGTSTSAPVDVRRWPGAADIAHLVLRDHTTVLSRLDVEALIRGLRTSGVWTVARTSALFPDNAAVFRDVGFAPIEPLALLELPLVRCLPPTSRPSTVAVRRTWRRHHDALVDLDRRAFPAGWANDRDSLRDTLTATPVARTRVVGDPTRLRGFAVTGLVSPTAYLQRLAVDPDDRRRGVATALVGDAVAWATRRGATSMLVNTGVDNDAALDLYRSLGFRRRPEELVVLERRLDEAP